MVNTHLVFLATDFCVAGFILWEAPGQLWLGGSTPVNVLKYVLQFLKTDKEVKACFQMNLLLVVKQVQMRAGSLRMLPQSSGSPLHLRSCSVNQHHYYNKKDENVWFGSVERACIVKRLCWEDERLTCRCRSWWLETVVLCKTYSLCKVKTSSGEYSDRAAEFNKC